MNFTIHRFVQTSAAITVAMVCAACSKTEESSENTARLDESETKVTGCHTNECVEASALHDGMFSVHHFEFIGKGPAHSKADIEKYNLDDFGSRGPDVHAKWDIQVPAENSGINKEAMPDVVRSIIMMVFEPHFRGEDPWHPSATIEEAESLLKAEAFKRYKCNPSEQFHECSRLEFYADAKLSWPFGTTPKENAKWYEKPVLAAINDGYANDGGMGCHSYEMAWTFSLPEGRKLTLDDYFPRERQKELSSAIWKRMLYDTLGDCEEARLKEDRNLDPDKEGYMFVTEKGIRWIFTPYMFFAGCYGTTSAEFTWEELEKYHE